VWVAVAVLIVTCPCALSLAAPATLVAAAQGLARRGVLLQRLEALERLARVQQVFVDKTGTLTDDRPHCRGVQLSPAGRLAFAAQGGRAAAADRAEDTALAFAAALAGWSAHPVAQALVEAAPATPHALPVWQGVEEQAGSGLRGLDGEGREWRLGAPAWAAAQDHTAAPPATRLVLGRGGQLMASFLLEESLRPGTMQALQALAAEGLQLSLLTGDAPERAQALAERLQLSDWQAHATPELKLAALTQAQQAGRTVAMVGDGINDAPVLARADVSLAMGQGALVARSQADAVITSNDLRDLVHARRTAQRAVRIVRQNMVWAAVYNATCIPLALVGWLPPWAAGLGMALSSLLVIGNALRAAR
jgi:Cu2+-exporting ATPase